jgi:Restriction endonuclease
MTSEALDTEYENGVADVLAFLAAGDATVDRNVHMPGYKSGVKRQIDVRVTGRIFGVGDATMVVDCKRYTTPLDVNDVATFVGLVEDVVADIGLMVTTTGASPAARALAKNSRGIRLDILSVEELARWSPKGTVNFDYAVPESLYAEARRSARRAGFRVRLVDVDEWRNLQGHVGLSAFRHFGVANPSVDVQAKAREHLCEVLRLAGVTEPFGMQSGVVINGGTPAHRYLDVTFAGEKIGIRILVASETDITAHLDALAESHGFPRGVLDVIRPEVWPIPAMFSWS